MSNTAAIANITIGGQKVLSTDLASFTSIVSLKQWAEEIISAIHDITRPQNPRLDMLGQSFLNAYLDRSYELELIERAKMPIYIDGVEYPVVKLVEVGKRFQADGLAWVVSTQTGNQIVRKDFLGEFAFQTTTELQAEIADYQKRIAAAQDILALV